MEGVRDAPELRGIIPNSFEHIFGHIKHAPLGVQYLVRASYLEIYNEDIRDLLNPKGDKLDIKERTDTGVYVKDLSTFVVSHCMFDWPHILPSQGDIESSSPQFLLG